MLTYKIQSAIDASAIVRDQLMRILLVKLSLETFIVRLLLRSCSVRSIHRDYP